MRTKSKSPKGTLLLLPGGGYEFIKVRNEGEKVASFLNAEGFDVAILEYHVGTGSQTRDLALIDALKAFRLLKTSGKTLGLRGDRLRIMGLSSGGHLAARTVQRLEKKEQPDDLILISPTNLNETTTGIVFPAVMPPVEPRARLFCSFFANDKYAWIKSCEQYTKTWKGFDGPASFHLLPDSAYVSDTDADPVDNKQRSSKEFQQAIALVRGGAIGHIEIIYAKVGDPPKPLDLPEQAISAILNWNLWMGSLNDPKSHYHSDLCPPITLDPVPDEKLWGAWRWYRETGNGFTADWGAHMFDIAQAAIGMDGSGPCEFIPKGYNGTQYLTMKYENGIVMTEQPFREKGGNDISFNGTKGWLKVTRGYIECSDPSLLKKEEKTVGVGQYEVSSPHMQNFIDAVRSRKNPIAPVEVGCSTSTLCCIANIATELQRPVKWDPATLSFGDDTEAANHRLYHYQYRRPYSL